MRAGKIFKINQRLEITLSNKSDAQQYVSRIEDIMNDHMIIAMPMEKGYPVFHSRGNSIYGKVFDESGVYSFKSTFVDKKMSHLPIWIITAPVDIKKNQQRSFVRFDIALPVIIECPLDDDEDEDEVVSMKLTTKDLSGGGLQVICNRTIEIGKRIHLTLDFQNYGFFEVEGEVVRINQPQADKRLFWIGIKFYDIPERIRDEISRFIFRKQLELRQKGL